MPAYVSPDTPLLPIWATGRVGSCASVSSTFSFAQGLSVDMSAEDGPITQAWLKSDHWGERLWTDQSVKQRLKEAYAEEKRTAKPPKTIDDIPFRYEDVNETWLEAVIAKDVPGAKLESFQLGPADSGTSDRRHITLNWNSVGQKAGLPASCFCKATQGLLNRLHLSFGAVQSEVNFYRSVRQLVKFEAPVAFHSQMNLDTSVVPHLIATLPHLSAATIASSCCGTLARTVRRNSSISYHLSEMCSRIPQRQRHLHKGDVHGPDGDHGQLTRSVL